MGLGAPLAMGLEIAIESLEILTGQSTRYTDMRQSYADQYITS